MSESKYDWKEIQKYYDEGHSTTEITKKFGCPSGSIAWAKKTGKLTLRSHSEAAKLCNVSIYNWQEIQKFYDDNHTWRDIEKKFGCCHVSIQKAIKRGELVLRTKSEANKLHNKLYGTRPHTEESKRKLSEKRIKYLQEHPEMVPYKLNHYSKKNSYPEEYFLDVFAKETIDLKHHKQVGLYEIDFYNEESMVAIEIDGEQHYVDPRIVESDKRKNQFLSERGWKVYRIRWAKYQRLSLEEKTKVVNEIREILKKKGEG